MAKSFVFRDRERRIVGYLQQHPNEIRCRINGIGQAADLIVYRAGEQEMRLHMDAGGCEQRFRDSGQHISGAVVVQGETLRCFTDDVAADAYERAWRSKMEKLRRTDRMPLRKEVEKAAAQNERKAEEVTLPEGNREQQAYRWPERRWPPPVCFSDAAYVQGRWMERETGRSTVSDHEGR
ncbi:MAG: hypothetical protein IKU73_04685 [Clostridia bacterium]|nr:hypothetical protein [Clostridia bacterium]